MCVYCVTHRSVRGLMPAHACAAHAALTRCPLPSPAAGWCCPSGLPLLSWQSQAPVCKEAHRHLREAYGTGMLIWRASKDTEQVQALDGREERAGTHTYLRAVRCCVGGGGLRRNVASLLCLSPAPRRRGRFAQRTLNPLHIVCAHAHCLRQAVLCVLKFVLL